MPLIITNEQMKPWLSKDNFKSILRIKPQPVKISSGAFYIFYPYKKLPIKTTVNINNHFF